MNSENMKIYKKVIHEDEIDYYFMKSENECIFIEYNPSSDFGEGSPSGTHIRDIEIHTRNSYKTESLTAISLDEVPKPILNLLTYLQISQK